MKPTALLLIALASQQGSDATTTTAGSCPNGDDCSCVYQGSRLESSVYTNYPSSNAGQYSSLSAIQIYGTTCAAWDQMPNTPWFQGYCNLTATTQHSDWTTSGNNWCQVPWCYVSTCCSSFTASSVFQGSSVAGYSYAACGAPDCYNAFATTSTCPYNPHGSPENTYMVHKGGTCACLYQGADLASDIYTNYPTDSPGQHQNIAAISSYGTTCAAWDSVPEMPWFTYCPADADFCQINKNWCIEPWCYVSSDCSTFVASSVFAGSSTAGYSYDTCGAPNCYTGTSDTTGATMPAQCPFDSTDAMTGLQFTQVTCASGYVGLTDPESSGASVGTGSVFAAAALATLVFVAPH
jgi:hypothetical protein